jgi:hypothetical protein
MTLDFGDFRRLGIPESALLPQAPCLSPEDFDVLLRSLQLLRISQLRYLVQRFSIPVSGNKTKLLGLVISIFHSLRYDPVLLEALAEINRLLEQQSDIFSNPLTSTGRLDIVPPDPSFWAPPNPLFMQSDPPFLFGPLLVPPGQFAGKFSFFLPPLRASAHLAFLFRDGEPHKFAFSVELNGFDFEITASDPFPNPIDVTQTLSLDKKPNTLEIKLIASSVPMMICLREFRYVGISFLAEKVCARKVHMSEKVLVIGRGCVSHDRFDLLDFLSGAVATGRWICPVCHRPIELGELMLSRLTPRDQEMETLAVGLFHPGADAELDWSMF